MKLYVVCYKRLENQNKQNHVSEMSTALESSMGSHKADDAQVKQDVRDGLCRVVSCQGVAGSSRQFDMVLSMHSTESALCNKYSSGKEGYILEHF